MNGIPEGIADGVTLDGFKVGAVGDTDGTVGISDTLGLAVGDTVGSFVDGADVGKAVGIIDGVIYDMVNTPLQVLVP